MTAQLAGTLLDQLAWRAREQPGREAFNFAGRSHSYGDLWESVLGVAAHLVERGVSPGDRIVVALPNGAEFFSSFYGILRAGAIAVPVFPGSGAGRLQSIARRCGARLVAAAPEVCGELALSSARLEAISPDASRPASSHPALPALDPRAVAYIQYTSGSTGEPKGVQITHANVLANVEQMVAGMELTPDEIFVSWLPVHHDMGLVLMTMAPFFLGARLFLLPASLREVRTWLETISKARGTFTAAPDFAYRLALRSVRDPAAFDLSSLRVALNAAEPVRARTLSEFEDAFGLDSVMVAGYGMAESTVGVSMWKAASPPKVDARGFVSVGRGFPDVDLAILGEEALLGPNTVGEILVRSPANTPGYWSDPAATEKLAWRDGYLRTGDLGYLDPEGDLFVVGRKKNIIIQAGRNIAPGEVEALIDDIPFVRKSAAVGVDRGGVEGEQIYAFVELRRHRALPRDDYRRMTIEVTRRIRAELGLGPGRVYLVPPRTIPLTHNGKTRHGELKGRYLDGSLASEGRLLFPEY